MNEPAQYFLLAEGKQDSQHPLIDEDNEDSEIEQEDGEGEVLVQQDDDNEDDDASDDEEEDGDEGAEEKVLELK